MRARGSVSGPQTHAPRQRAASPRQRAGSPWPWAIVAGVSLISTFSALLLAAFVLMLDSGAPSGLHIGGVPVGGLSEADAAAALTSWALSVYPADAPDSAVWVAAPELGLRIDAAASAAAAFAAVREGGFGFILRAWLERADVPAVVTFDRTAAEAGLMRLAAPYTRAARSAGVVWRAGGLAPRAAETGRVLDLPATLAGLAADGLTDGRIALVFAVVQPAITDPAPLLAAAQQFVSGPLTLRLIDPIANTAVDWAIPPEIWAAWLSLDDSGPEAPGPGAVDVNEPRALPRFSIDEAAAAAYLAGRAAELGEGRTLDAVSAVGALNGALAAGNRAGWAQVRHTEVRYTVQAGDSLISIAYAYGIPYPYLQQANPGLEALSIGQTITLPSRDIMLPLPIHPDKRLVVSMREQRVRGYERGQLVFDWPASTGISSSPTWPGVYQVLSHVENAYAGNWDLWMPYFIGVYRPVPGADFTNGFHGFPTRGGSQLLWTDSLGTRVTYGCILVSNTHARTLFTWAELGVVVEIQA
jgi:LysM repeat protein